MRTVTYDFLFLLEEAQRENFRIPHFQRAFTWNQAQTKLLVDSVARNFPIGSILLLEENNPKEPFLASRSLSAVLQSEFDGDDEEDKDKDVPESPIAFYYVLDGQQRLTSLVHAFLDAQKDSRYYFDLQKLLKFDPGQTNWIVKRDKKARTSKRYLRSDVIRDAEKCQVWIDEYYESDEPSLEGDRQAQRKASARVNRIFETIRNYKIPIVVIDRSESTEAICRIFETINSTGTRLTTFDLAVARFYPRPDLHLLKEKAWQQHPILDQFDVEPERVLQEIAALDQLPKKVTLTDVARSALLSLQKQSVEDLWPPACSYLSQACEWIERKGVTPNLMITDTLLVPIATYFYLKETHTDASWRNQNPGADDVLEKWFFVQMLQQGARQATNYRIGQQIEEFRVWMVEGKPLSIPTIEFSAEDLMTIRSTDNRYKAVHALLRCRTRTDISTGSDLASSDIEDHHLFPSALSSRKGISRRKLDAIVNRLVVSKETNRRLKERMPIDYLKDIITTSANRGTLSVTRERFARLCIPFDDANFSIYETDNLDRFLTVRAQLIFGVIKDMLGDRLISQSGSTSEDNDEVD